MAGVVSVFGGSGHKVLGFGFWVLGRSSLGLMVLVAMFGGCGVWLSVAPNACQSDFVFSFLKIDFFSSSVRTDPKP